MPLLERETTQGQATTDSIRTFVFDKGDLHELGFENEDAPLTLKLKAIKGTTITKAKIIKKDIKKKGKIILLQAQHFP